MYDYSKAACVRVCVHLSVRHSPSKRKSVADRQKSLTAEDGLTAAALISQDSIQMSLDVDNEQGLSQTPLGSRILG